jgi:hypothetical protein
MYSSKVARIERAMGYGDHHKLGMTVGKFFTHIADVVAFAWSHALAMLKGWKIHEQSYSRKAPRVGGAF